MYLDGSATIGRRLIGSAALFQGHKLLLHGQQPLFKKRIISLAISDEKPCSKRFTTDAHPQIIRCVISLSLTLSNSWLAHGLIISARGHHILAC